MSLIFLIIITTKINLTITTTVSARIEGPTKVGGPKRLVHSREIKIHASERFHRVVIRFDSQVPHLTQPEIHSLSSPVSILMKEAAVASE